MWRCALGGSLALVLAFAGCGGGGDGPPPSSFVAGGSSAGGGSGAGGTATGGTSAGGTSGSGGSATGGTSGGGTGGAGGTGGTTTGTGCNGYTTISADAACTKWATSHCNIFTQCWTEYLILVGWDSLATCQARIKLGCLQTLSAPGVQWKPAAYAAGADIWSQTTCDKLYAFENPIGSSVLDNPACGSPGSLADGAGCYDDEQCASSDCDVPSGAVCGTCKPKAKLNGACSVDNDCEQDLYCASKTCHARAKLGETCTANPQCVKGAFCDAGKCATRLSAGGTCDETSDCDTILVCSAGGTCKAPTLGVVGASCDPTEAYSCNSFKGYNCDPTTKKCVAATYPGPNQPCGGTTGKYWCTGGAKCVIAPGQTSGTCMKVAADGAACSDSTGPECSAPADCVNGKCTIVDQTICP